MNGSDLTLVASLEPRLVVFYENLAILEFPHCATIFLTSTLPRYMMEQLVNKLEQLKARTM